MVFKIGDTDVSRCVTPPQITEEYRSQSVNHTLNGSAVVDRIANYPKRRIEVTLGVMDKAAWEALKAYLKSAAELNITIDGEVISVYLDGGIPTPIIYAKKGGYMCAGMELAFEEM